MRSMSLLALAACAALVLPRNAVAQKPPQPLSHRLIVARPELERYLGQLREQALTPKRGGLSEDFLRGETTYVQQRLTEGDFRVGDRLLVMVEDPGPIAGVIAGAGFPPAKTPEQQLSDTFTVGTNQEVPLPGVGIVSLRGVLRSELEPFLTVQIGRYIRDPVVHVRPLISLAVSGGVLKPGYYTVPANSVLPAVITAAGGSVKGGALNDVAVRRSGHVVMDKHEVRTAVAAGHTIDEMDLHPGDEVVVPEKTGGAYDAVKFTAVLLSIPISLYTLGQIFKH